VVNHIARVYLEGQQPSSEYHACLSHKQWGKVVPEFAVVGTIPPHATRTATELRLTLSFNDHAHQGGKATYKGQALVTKDGPLTVPDLVDGSGIH
jgi:hypothetical protein